MKKILDYINNLSEGKFIAVSLLVALIFTVPFTFYNVYSNNIYGGPQFSINMLFGWASFVNIIITPILESILIVIVSRLIGQATDNKFMITFITAILFLGAYNYSMAYAIINFISSFIFVSAYVLYKNNKRLSSFSIMVIIHLIYNLIQMFFTVLATSLLK